MKYLLISLMILVGCVDNKPVQSYHYEVIVNEWSLDCKEEQCYSYGCSLYQCIGKSEIYGIEFKVDEIRQVTNYIKVKDE